jgi:hypothetical protein
MKFISMFSLILIVTVRILVAQTDFRPGYVLKAGGDSLFGEIDYRGDILAGETCRFRASDTHSETRFSPSDILGYRFINSKYFVSREVNGELMFLEFLIKGKINIYYHRSNKEDKFYLEKDGLGFTEIPYSEYIAYQDNKEYETRSAKYIGLLSYYMQDAPEFQSRIATMGKPRTKNLIALAEDYHNSICKDESCLIFEKQLPFLKIFPEIVFGVISSKNGSEMIDMNYYYHEGEFSQKSYMTAGVLTHIWIPRVNEKFYLRTGLLYSSFTRNSQSKLFFKIPLQAEYIYPRGIFRPKLAYGVSIYTPFYYSVAINAGANIEISRSVFLGLNYSMDFLPSNIPILPNKILSNTISGGLFFKL